MTTYEFVMLLAVFLSPIVAVIITLIIEERRKTKESKLVVVRLLMHTRHLPSDPMYSAAINLIPIEFHKNSKVMDAYNKYIDSVRYSPSPENLESHIQGTFAYQTKLIFEVLKDSGFDIPETTLQTTAYASIGFVERDTIYLDSLRATKEIAATLKEQTRILKGQE